MVSGVRCPLGADHPITDLQVLDARAVTTFEEELARDVITLMTVFCARLYGRRSGRNKRISDARDEGLKTA